MPFFLYPRPYLQTLAQSGVAVTAPADVAENTLFTYTLPGRLMGINDRLEIKLEGTNNNNANIKTWKLYFDASVILNNNQTTNTTHGAEFFVQNRGDLASQVFSNGSWVTVGAALTTQAGTVNTASDVTIKLTGTKAVAGDTMTLEWYSIRLIRSP
jgi:hypothetical protein